MTEPYVHANPQEIILYLPEIVRLKLMGVSLVWPNAVFIA